MQKLWKVIMVIFVAVITAAVIWNSSSSQQYSEARHQQGSMGPMMGKMHDMMEDCTKWASDWDDIMKRRVRPGTMGMMGMRSMGVTMYNMSWNLRRMMGDLEYMLNDDEMMQDPVIKENAEEMRQHMETISNRIEKMMMNMKEIANSQQGKK
jgi:hypothetical protein